LERFVTEHRFCLLLHDMPPPGLVAGYVDCVRTDDSSGEVCAAQILLQKLPNARDLAVLAGPKDDRQGSQRVEGGTSPARQIIRSLPPHVRQTA
jgi:hypothetical protein